MFRHAFAAALVALVALPPAASRAARIVNVQSAASREAEEGFSGEVAGTLLWSTGNTEVSQAAATVGLLFLDGPHRVFLSGRAAYGIEAGDTYINNLFEHLRYRYQLAPWLSGETFVQHEYDEFRRLEFRALLGLGPRFDVALSDAWDLAFGTAWMVENERYSDDGEVDAGTEQTNHRWSSYVFAGGPIADEIGLSQTFYVQPRFDEFDDFRLLSETSALLDVKDWLAVKLAFTAAYDSTPPATVEKLDTTYTTSLLFRI